MNDWLCESLAVLSELTLLIHAIVIYSVVELEYLNTTMHILYSIEEFSKKCFHITSNGS